MFHHGIRRCDLCSSEMLGHGGKDVCFLCDLMTVGDPDIVDDAEAPLASGVAFFTSRGLVAALGARAD